MTQPQTSFDPVWEEKYKNGHQEKAPWDNVVSFIYTHRPRDKAFKDIKILEVGCGTGSNLWFAALEGFDVTGLDGSASAITMAKDRFAEFDLSGRLDVGDFTNLPYDDNQFDMIVDRGALCCCGESSLTKALGEINRVLKPKGKFLHTPFSKNHTSYAGGENSEDKTITNITRGTLTGVGQIFFVDEHDIKTLIQPNKWDLLTLTHHHDDDKINDLGVHASWTVIAEKK